MATTRRGTPIGVVVAALVVLLISWATPASAGPPLSGAGSGVITSLVETSSRDAGGNRIAERRLEGVMTGALQGTFVEEVRGVVHRNGVVNFHGTLTFTGEVAGCGTGTITGRLQGRGQGNPPLTDATITVVNQAANTVAVTGRGTVAQTGPFLSYEIQYSCR